VQGTCVYSDKLSEDVAENTTIHVVSNLWVSVESTQSSEGLAIACSDVNVLSNS
jgi:hypothetical protein